MSNTETIFLIAASVGYLATIGLAFSRSSRSRAMVLSISAALTAHLISAGIRWIEIGHPPVFGTYEATLAASWFLALTALLAVNSHRYISFILPLTALFSVLHIAYGLNFNTSHIPLTISEKSIWVDLHALTAWLAYGEFSISFFLSLILILRVGESAWVQRRITDFPSDEIIDELILKYLVLGFIFHTLMFALGSYYSSILYGKWWTWDPVDTLFMVSWIVYALIIHLRLFYGWKRERMAKLVVIAMITIMVGYWSLIYIPWATYHIFDIDMKMHG